MKNWHSAKNFENMKEIFQKYKCPSNCASDPPKVNVELWKLLSSWKKKSDVKFVSMQKSLKKSLNASLQIFDSIQNKKLNLQEIAQTTVNIAAILGHVSYDISIKRRVFIESVLNNDYKNLCSSAQPITEFLFGDDLPKQVKGLNLTNKIGNKFISKPNYKSRNYHSNNYERSVRSRPYYKRNSFLGRGRGNLPYQHPSKSHQYKRK